MPVHLTTGVDAGCGTGAAACAADPVVSGAPRRGMPTMCKGEFAVFVSVQSVAGV
jgi:hypothetical protein